MRLGVVLWITVKVLLWFSFRAIFLLFRQVTWLLTGITFRLWNNQRENAYAGTAHVRTIWFRFKMDLMIQPANLNNFITVHHSFQNPEYIFSKNVTLYTLTENRAVFVESLPECDATSSKYSSFFRIAQFQLAQRLIIVPIDVFHNLANQIGDPSGRLIFLTNTSRCGSTLLTQVFEETGRSTAISEPDAMYAISVIQEKLPKHDVSQLLISTVRMLCKPTGTEKDTFVIKLSQQTMSLTPNLVHLFPTSKHLFMYRNGLKVAQSVAKLMRSLPYLEFIMVFARRACCMHVARKVTTKFGLPTSDFDSVGNVLGPLYVGAIVWASSIHRYLGFKRDGLPVVAVRYEDMMEDSHYALKQIFDYCELEYQKDATERAFARDSQENSPISRDSLKHFQRDEVISEETTEHIDNVCKIFKVPLLYEFYIAEDTITRKIAITEEETTDIVAMHPSSRKCHTRCASEAFIGQNVLTGLVPEQIIVTV